MREVTYDPNHVRPAILDAIAGGSSLSAAIKKLDPAP